ncbi:coiled-coil domain-containing protein 142 isoform X3 [Artibeus jamaicensis]|uniref:coiled-coil domain-containing protein 142 isoform X3 n=1 Tax=Artibeus jamaicensis TaxID=9417 RepID=UPI00235A60EF|nr:coiled-coil domain-containing protein 142 isoform X3 [Artibeus jamaicensis]
MAHASPVGGLLPLLAPVPQVWPPDGATGEERRERRPAGALGGDVSGWPRPLVAGSIPCLDQLPSGAPEGQPWWAAPDTGEHHEAGTADPRQKPAAGGQTPPALQRLRTVLLRLHREREQLLQAQDCARHLQAAVRLLRVLSTGAPSPGLLPQLCLDLLAQLSRKAVLRTGLRETPEPLLLARPVGLAAHSLDAVIEMQLRALGRAPASPGLSSQLADLLLALPLYHQLQGKALSHVPGAACPFPPARVLCLLAGERGCQAAGRLNEALRGLDLRDQLRKWWCEEQELLPGLLGLIGGVAGSASSGLGIGGAGTLWSQYWTQLWAACAQSLDLSLGPWKDRRVAARQLSQALDQASLPQECEKELASLCHGLFHQSLIWSWDQVPAPLALGLCTLQTTLLWFWGRAQQHLAVWAPESFLLLIQKDLPPLLHEAEALSSLASGESVALDLEEQLGLEIRKLTLQMQLLLEESLSLFLQECHKQATRGFELHMPRGRYWRHPLCLELPSIPSEYARLVVHTVLEPVLQGLQGLPPPAQIPVLGQVLTTILGAWLDHILTHRIRFSLQGALQLRQDFGVVRELLEEERWGLSPETRQTLLMLNIFQRLDGALLCLLQQPLPKTQVHRRPPCCCACNEVQTLELPSSSLNSLESLEPPLRTGAPPAQAAQLLSTLWGGGPSPQAYLVGNQQAWLALRQHQRHPRWHLPFLSCLGTSPES